MQTAAILILSALAGYCVNLVADVVPERKPIKRFWRMPLSRPQTLRPLLVWIAAFALGWMSYQHWGWSLQALTAALYAWFFLVVAVIDIEHRLVLNRMLIPALGGILLLTLALHGFPGLITSLTGGAIGFVSFLALALVYPKGMGMGDVKLAGVIGLATGFPGILVVLLVCIFAGGVGALLILIRYRFKPGHTMAYAPYLSLGGWAALYFSSQLIHTYLHLAS